MIELDFPQLERAYCRAVCRHHLTEREMIVALTIMRLSFGICEPYLKLDYAIELSRETGISKGNAHEAVRRLVRSRAIEVSPDRCIYTPLPPSKNWPWLYKERVDFRVADEIEKGIVWANKGAQQGELFSPPAEEEFSQALAVERMRQSLLEYHQAAAARFAGGLDFSVTDRSPTPAPGPQGLSSSEGRTRPLETTVAGVSSSAVESFIRRPEEASEMLAPRPRLPDEGGSRFGNSPGGNGSRIGNPVPDSGTALLKDFKDSKGDIPFNSLKALKAQFPNREPMEALDPGATEEEIVGWMKKAFGKLCRPCFEARHKCACAKPELVPVMDVLGGWWRLRIRESRWAAINTCMELFLRFTDPHLKPLRNPGGWARDTYFKIRGEEAAGKQETQTS